MACNRMSRLLVVLLLVLLGGIPTSAEGPHTKSEGLVPDDGRPRGKVLYNGIRLPDQWPPRTDKLTREPMPAPYLKNPPAIIPINVGRQLFVDDFLIEKTTLQRVFHQPEYYKQNPVLAPETSCEVNYEGHWFAAPFSGGAAFNPRDGLFKLFYRGGFSAICYAASENGLDWEKPYLDVNLAALAGEPVRFRFHLRNGSLYAFWVSPDQSGASHGYVSAGGPGFAGPTDTVGQSAAWPGSQQGDSGDKK